MTDRKRTNRMARPVDQHGISRRDVLRGGVLIPASVMLPVWMTARAQVTSGPSGGPPGGTIDYFISTTGNDSNPGTLSAPWAITSLVNTNANNAKTAGKNVGLIAGTYNVSGTGSGGTKIGSGNNPTNGSYCALSLRPGSASASTWVGSCNSSGVYTPRAAIIFVASGQTSGSSNQWNNAIIGVDAGNGGYVTLDGIVVNANGMNCPGANGNEGAHIFMTQGTNGSFTSAGNQPGIVVQNCELYGINATDSGGNDAAIFLSGTQGEIIQNNYIHDVNKSSQIDHSHGIEAYGCQNGQWIYNTFAKCTGGAAEAKEGCGGITCAYNYFYDCSVGGSGNAAVLQGWDGAEGNPNTPTTAFALHHNIFDSCGRVTFGESNNANHTQAVHWYNNTVYNSGDVVLQSSGGGGLIQHYNNLYVLAAPASGFQQFTSGGYSVLDYDCSYTLNGSYNGMWQMSNQNFNSLASFQSAAGAESHAIPQATDPKFTSGTTALAAGAGAAQFKLASGSPCVSTGRGGVNIGAWDGSVTQIGCSFALGATSTPTPIPSAPVLSVS